MTDGCCWISSTDGLPLTTEICPTGSQQSRRINLPIWANDFRSWVYGWATERGLVGKWCSWDGSDSNDFVFEVRVTRDQLVDFCADINQRFKEPQLDILQQFLGTALRADRVYLLSGDTF